MRATLRLKLIDYRACRKSRGLEGATVTAAKQQHVGRPEEPIKSGTGAVAAHDAFYHEGFPE